MPVVFSPTSRIVAYHGTTALFSQFRSRPSGLHFGTLDQAAHRLSRLCARLPVRAYARLPMLEGGMRGYLLEVTLIIVSALRVDDARTGSAWARLIRRAQAAGHDALVYRNAFEMPHARCDSWVVFQPEQVASIAYPFNASQDVLVQRPSPF